MATKKASAKKATTRKASTRKASAKAVSAKKQTASAEAVSTRTQKRKSSIDLSKSIKAVPGQDEHFYKKFPRYAAYCELLAAPKHTMKVATFVEKIEKLDGVANRKQALGIVQKLVDKKRHVGAVCASFV